MNSTVSGKNNALFLPQNNVCNGRKGSVGRLHSVSCWTRSQIWIKACWRLGQNEIDVVGKSLFFWGGGYQIHPRCHCNIISNYVTLVIRRKQKKKLASTSNCVIPLVWRGGSRVYSIMKHGSRINFWFSVSRPAQIPHRGYADSAEAVI